MRPNSGLVRAAMALHRCGGRGEKRSMMNPRMAVSALSMGVLLLGAGATRADQGKKGPETSLQLPITGTVAGGGTFAGTLSLQKFVVRDGQVAAVGIGRGTVTNAAGVPVGAALGGP